MRRKLWPILSLMCCLVLATAAKAQTRVLHGRVVDVDTKQGVPRALLSVVGGREATQSDQAGDFRLAVPDGALRLNVRALGYAPRAVSVAAGDSVLSIILTPEAIQLNQIVVTGAATTQERRNVATAVSVVSADALNTVPAASVDQALQGKVLGATVNMYSGAPGGGGQIQIRGVTSILGNGQPLFVVDGTIISNVSISSGINAVTRAAGGGATGSQDNAVNRLADLNPDQIESVQILKSAAASAIYGSEATNGVVIITTKRGAAGAPQFHLTQKFGNYTPLRVLGQRHFTQADLTAVLGDATVSAQYCPGSSTSACPYYDNMGALYSQKKLAYETDGSLTGGNNTTKYYASVSNKYDPGTEVATGATRQNMRLNLDQAFGSRWTTSTSLSVFRSVTARGISNNDNSFVSPLYGFAYTPPVVNLQAKDASGHYVDNPILPFLFGAGSNPFQTLQGMSSNESVWRQLGSGQARFTAYTSERQSLTLQATGGFDSFSQDGQTYSPPYLEYERLDYPATPGSTVQAQATSKYLNGMLSAVHVWTPGQGLFSRITSATTSGGLQYDDRYLNQYTILARGLIPGVTDFTQGTPTLTQNKSDVRDLATFLSEEVLAFNEHLSLSGHVRAERSSVNGDPQKVYYYPAGAASYRFTNLFPHADEIKLRAAIGVSGNQPGYGQRDIVISPNGVIGGTNTLGAPGALGNSHIKPERMRELEYGMDATLFDQRVGFEASLYTRDITDLLLNAPLATTTGYSSTFINGGHMQTKGVELGLTLLPIRNRSFTWTSHTTFFHYASTMISLPSNVAPFVVGGSGFGASYGHGRISPGYKTTLIWGNKQRADGSVVDTVVADGNPDFQMSFGNDFQVGPLEISTLLDWRKGGSLSDLTQNLYDEGQTAWDYNKPSPDPKYPNLGSYRYGTWNAGKNSTAYIQDGSFVKLREITVAYPIPASVSRRFFGGHDARLNVSGRNLHTWTKYWGADPEVSNFGAQNVDHFVDLAPYPPSRSFFFGFDVAW